MTYISTRDLHDREVKVRLTDDDYELLEQLARRNGLKTAALARMLIRRGLTHGCVAAWQRRTSTRANEGPPRDPPHA